MKKLDFFEFKSKVDDGKPIVVKFKSDFCHVCNELEPDYNFVSTLFPGIEFYDIDINEEEELAELFIKDGVPTIYFINDKTFKELKYPKNGFDKKSLNKAIKKIAEKLQWQIKAIKKESL